jgi:hypothetical protein
VSPFALSVQAHQAYKSEMVSFLKSLPAVALTKLLRLPEPAWLPKRTKALPQHAAMLQEQPLSQSCRDSNMTEATAKHELLHGQGKQGRLSKLAQLCCGKVVDKSAAEVDDECLPLLAPPGQQQQPRQAGVKNSGLAAAAGSKEPLSAVAAAAVQFAAECGACCSGSGCGSNGSISPHGSSSSSSRSCSCRCHADVQQLLPALPPVDAVIDLLEQASEGTWLCNPRLLQQPHTSSCSCSVCQGLAGHDKWSHEAVLDSIAAGFDVFDVLGEHGADDAALAYTVERRLMTAHHKVRDVRE